MDSPSSAWQKTPCLSMSPAFREGVLQSFNRKTTAVLHGHMPMATACHALSIWHQPPTGGCHHLRMTLRQQAGRAPSRGLAAAPELQQNGLFDCRLHETSTFALYCMVICPWPQHPMRCPLHQPPTGGCHHLRMTLRQRGVRAPSGGLATAPELRQYALFDWRLHETSTFALYCMVICPWPQHPMRCPLH